MQFQLGSYIHVCTNEIHSLASLHNFISVLAGLCCYKFAYESRDLNLVDLLENVYSFEHMYMDVTTKLELCLHEQTQIVANTAYRVGSQQFLCYVDS